MSDATLHPRQRAYALDMMRRRVRRLTELLASDRAPDTLIASEAYGVGETATMLAPYYLAEKEAARADAKLRRSLELCVYHGCARPAALTRDDGLCAEHSRELDDMAGPEGGDDAS